MPDKLVSYIHKQKKKGFRDEQIHTHLRKHGWHDLHIRKAFSALTKKRNQKFIAYSIWYMLIIFIVTLSLVQLGKYTGFFAVDSAYCFGTVNGMNSYYDKSICCELIDYTGCAELETPLPVKVGQIEFWGEYRCYNGGVNIFFTKENFQRC